MPRKPGFERTPEERERERKNKWVQRQRARGNFGVTAADAPSSNRDTHPKPFDGPLEDDLAWWQIEFEEAMGIL